MIDHLMVFEEDEKLGIYHYRIACDCTNSDHDLDIFIDISSEPLGSEKDMEILYWNLYLSTYPSIFFHASEFKYDIFNKIIKIYRRMIFGIKLIFGYDSVYKFDFLVSKKSFPALKFVVDKMESLIRKEKNASIK